MSPSLPYKLLSPTLPAFARAQVLPGNKQMMLYGRSDRMRASLQIGLARILHRCRIEALCKSSWVVLRSCRARCGTNFRRKRLTRLLLIGVRVRIEYATMHRTC